MFIRASGVYSAIHPPKARLAKDWAQGYAAYTTLNVFRTNRSLRTVAVMVTFLGWFVLSNHCAIGRMLPRAEAESQKAHGCCHNGTSQPVKEPGDGRQGMQCCKSLHVVVPDGAKLPVASSLDATYGWNDRAREEAG